MVKIIFHFYCDRQLHKFLLGSVKKENQLLHAKVAMTESVKSVPERVELSLILHENHVLVT